MYPSPFKNPVLHCPLQGIRERANCISGEFHHRGATTEKTLLCIVTLEIVKGGGTGRRIFPRLSKLGQANAK